MDASEGRGAAVKKREETHRMAEANKAFPITVGKHGDPVDSECGTRQIIQSRI